MSQASHTQEFTVNAPPDEVFPLFGPIREKQWAPGWNPRILHSKSEWGDSVGTVFTSQHDDNAMETLWHLNRWDAAAHEVEYLYVMVGLWLVVIRIKCSAEAETNTRVTVGYTFTALSGLAEHALQGHLERHIGYVREWKEMINSYLAAS